MKSGGYHLSSLKGGSPFALISNATCCMSIEPLFQAFGSLAPKVAPLSGLFKTPAKKRKQALKFVFNH